jgi:hypothetical protein
MGTPRQRCDLLVVSPPVALLQAYVSVWPISDSAGEQTRSERPSALHLHGPVKPPWLLPSYVSEPTPLRH